MRCAKVMGNNLRLLMDIAQSGDERCAEPQRSSVVFSPHCVCLINLLEEVQRHFIKRLTGLWDVNYDLRLKLCKLERLENRRVNDDLLLVNKLLHNKCVSCIKDHLCIQTTNTRGHYMKLFKSRCKLDIHKYFL